jgi:hypothetical protein
MNTLTQSILTTPPNAPQHSEHPPFIDTRHKNIEVNKVYTNIITDMRWLLCRMNSTEHRSYILASYTPTDKYNDNILCEFVCVMCELRLSVREYCYYIELDTDSGIAKVIGGYNFRKMLRAAYRHTNYENTQHDLEDIIVINTDMQDHHSYFKNRLKDATSEDAIIVKEEDIVE